MNNWPEIVQHPFAFHFEKLFGYFGFSVDYAFIAPWKNSSFKVSEHACISATVDVNISHNKIKDCNFLIFQGILLGKWIFKNSFFRRVFYLNYVIQKIDMFCSYCLYMGKRHIFLNIIKCVAKVKVSPLLSNCCFPPHYIFSSYILLCMQQEFHYRVKCEYDLRTPKIQTWS